MNCRSRKSFTLVELLVVLAIVAILSTVVVMALNPAELLKQTRDSNRLSDLSTLNTALATFNADVTGGFMGTSTVVYVSVPDSSSVCANLNLPALPAGYTYNCSTSANYRKADGTGWIPVNFSQITFGAPLSNLPIDPQNTTTTAYYTYVTGGSWQLTSKLESQRYQSKAASTNDYDPGLYAVGTNTGLAPFVGGLVGWWKFDEGVGTTTADSSGWGNNGTASGTTIIAGKIGNARSFGGSPDCVTIGNNSSLNPTKITIAAWVLPVNVPWANTIGMNKEGQYRFLDRAGAGQIYIRYATTNALWGGTGTAQGSTILTPGVWQHIAVAYTGSSWNLYLNGQPDGSKVESGNLVSGSSQLTLGCALGSYFFSGSFDDLRIYNRALSATEVAAMYNATK